MTDESNNMVMPVGPMGGGNGFGNAFGGDWAWIILLLLLAGNGWGNGNGFGGNNGIMPYMWNTQTQSDVNRGFADAALTNQLSSIQTALANAELSNANRANAMQSQFAQCCCDNRLSIANLSADIAREACSDRQAVSDGVQRILDQMCADKIDAKNERIADLERQLTMANLAASQNAQTAQILANNEAQTTALEQYLAPVPRPAYIVQNPNCCSQNFGCGCSA